MGKEERENRVAKYFKGNSGMEAIFEVELHEGDILRFENCKFSEAPFGLSIAYINEDKKKQVKTIPWHRIKEYSLMDNSSEQ